MTANASAKSAIESTPPPPDDRASAVRPVRTDARLRGHVLPLDGVRGLAIGMVLLVHFVGNTVATNRFEKIVTRVSEYGAFGVDLFFVLSGFLITGILYDQRGLGPGNGYFKNFYMRRALRIFPLYYGVLAAMFVLLAALPSLSPDLAQLKSHQWWAWLYGVNVLVAKEGAFNLPYIDHFWSLAVEEHFYFFWPLIVWLCPGRTLLKVSLGISAAALVGRIVALYMGVSPVALYVLTPFRFDALCLGGFLAVYARRERGLDDLQRMLKPTLATASGIILVTFVFNRFTHFGYEALRPIRESMFVVLFGVTIIHALTASPTSLAGRFFTNKTLRFLGTYSYGLYVFHHFLSYWFVRHQTEFTIARWVGSHTAAVALQASVGVVVSMLVAMASYHLFEKRFLSLKKKFGG